MDTRRPALSTALLVTAIGLVGCTTGTPSSSGTSTSPEPSVTTASPTDAAADDESQLPLPVHEIADWAKGAVPDPEPGAGFGIMSGWLSQNTSPNQLTTMESLDPGAFQAQIACRGERTITIAVGELDESGESDTVSCSNETVAFDATTAATGIRIELGLDGPPTIYAVSMLRME